MNEGSNRGFLLYTDAKTNKKHIVPDYRIYGIEEHIDSNNRECTRIYLQDRMQSDSLIMVTTKETIWELYEQFR